MNEDELARLLRATPDEPELPDNPVALVRQKSAAMRRRRRGGAATLALIAVAAVGGVAVAAPGSHDGGAPNRVQVATPSASDSATATAVSSAIVTSSAVASTSTATPASTAPPIRTTDPAVTPHLTFTLQVSVDGLDATVGGYWSGSTQQYYGYDPQTRKLGAPEGTAVGVFGISSAGSSGFDGGNPAGASQCSGPVISWHEIASTATLHFDEPGTYTITEKSETCAGEVDATDVVTVRGPASSDPPTTGSSTASSTPPTS